MKKLLSWLKRIIVKVIGFLVATAFIIYLYGVYGLLRKTKWKKEPAIIFTMLAINLFFWIVTIKYILK